jgi:hypothetical protein
LIEFVVPVAASAAAVQIQRNQNPIDLSSPHPDLVGERMHDMPRIVRMHVDLKDDIAICIGHGEFPRLYAQAMLKRHAMRCDTG